MFKSYLLTVLSAGLLGTAAVAVPEPSSLPDYNRTASGGWSWQRTEAKVNPAGDLSWNPEPFVFRPVGPCRYIDYEKGNDANAGTSVDSPWRHHPWDARATEQARRFSGPATYVFRRGVIYRGLLRARESGLPGQPIVLTSDPAWGQGEAELRGSVVLRGPWRRATAGMLEFLPEPERVWYAEVPAGPAPRTVWENGEGRLMPLVPARTPNWRFSDPDDMRRHWYKWELVEEQRIKTAVDGTTRQLTRARDSRLAGLPAAALKGAVVWSEFQQLIGNPLPGTLYAFDSRQGTVDFDFPAFRKLPVRDCRYYLEGRPAFLDCGGEFYYDGKQRRLYLRLPGDRDPNRSRIEIGRERNLIDLSGRKHIVVSGLTLTGNRPEDDLLPRWSRKYTAPGAILIRGGGEDILIANCRFSQLDQAVHAQAEGTGGDRVIDRLTVRDCDLTDVADAGLYISDGYTSHNPVTDVLLYRVRILRNRLTSIGFRSPYNLGVAIQCSNARLAEIAGNLVTGCGGMGINVYGGKGGHISEDLRTVPLIRVLVHHNRVVDSLLLLNDYGGIETWMGGPAYLFSNVSGNPGGYWHWRDRKESPGTPSRIYTSARFGYAYYLDGSFKNYLFNNIAWGRNNDLGSPRCNSAALQEIHGFQNSIFNNTFYRFATASRRQQLAAGRSFYLGNLWVDMTAYFFNHDAWRSEREKNTAADFSSMVFARNFFQGRPNYFGSLDYGSKPYRTIGEFTAELRRRGAFAAETGTVLAQDPLVDPARRDFRPRSGAPIRGQGVRYFVPWGLYGVVGEWHFYRFPSGAPEVIRGENLYLTSEYRQRLMYHSVPTSDLTCVNLRHGDFVDGTLENWTAGALAFNGKNTWCVLRDRDMKRDVAYSYYYRNRDCKSTFKGSDRPTPDMDVNNFLIEAVFRVASDGADGTVVSKQADGRGYALGTDRDGRLALRLLAGPETLTVRTSERMSPGRWIHAVAEVDRRSGTVRLYLDGKPAATESSGTFPAAAQSLSNRGDLLVGRSPDGNFFHGALDFLRLSRGTLAEAQTTIGELYAWQFAGPFLSDFSGRRAGSVRLDAGAIDGEPAVAP